MFQTFRVYEKYRHKPLSNGVLRVSEEKKKFCYRPSRLNYCIPAGEFQYHPRVQIVARSHWRSLGNERFVFRSNLSHSLCFYPLFYYRARRCISPKSRRRNASINCALAWFRLHEAWRFPYFVRWHMPFATVYGESIASLSRDTRSSVVANKMPLFRRTHSSRSLRWSNESIRYFLTPAPIVVSFRNRSTYFPATPLSLDIVPTSSWPDPGQLACLPGSQPAFSRLALPRRTFVSSGISCFLLPLLIRIYRRSKTSR